MEHILARMTTAPTNYGYGRGWVLNDLNLNNRERKQVNKQLMDAGWRVSWLADGLHVLFPPSKPGITKNVPKPGELEF